MVLQRLFFDDSPQQESWSIMENHGESRKYYSIIDILNNLHLKINTTLLFSSASYGSKWISLKNRCLVGCKSMCFHQDCLFAYCVSDTSVINTKFFKHLSFCDWFDRKRIIWQETNHLAKIVCQNHSCLKTKWFWKNTKKCIWNVYLTYTFWQISIWQAEGTQMVLQH